MARYKATVDTPRPPDDAFAYLSDFSTTAEWDPGVVEAERIGKAPVADGSEFRLVADFLHRKTTLTYRIVEYDPPNAVTFRGKSRASSRWTRSPSSPRTAAHESHTTRTSR